MPSNPLVISTARDLYLKHGGHDHRLIEREMRALGCDHFSRRRFYNQRTPKGIRRGWIEKYGWKQGLNGLAQSEASPSQAETRPLGSVSMQRDQSAPSSFTADHRTDGPPKGGTPDAPADFPAWLKLISPGMRWDWRYQQLIYEKLEAVTRGTCKRLMLFLPPRHGKSELVTVRYTAYRLQQDPSLNVILGSYNQRLANRFSRKVRITWEDALVRNDGSEPPASAGGLNSKNEKPAIHDNSCSFVVKEQSANKNAHEPPRNNSQFSTLNSQLPSARRRLNTVAEWETGLGGGVRAVGVGAGITGYGAKLVIVDDPVRSRAEAESKTYRERVWDWFNDDLYTRLEPDAAIILIQTRWHEDDLAGRLLKDANDSGEHWDVVSLPALAEDNSTAETPRRRGIENCSATAGVSGKSPVEDSARELQTNGSIDLSSPRLGVSAVETNGDPLGRSAGEALCPDSSNEDLTGRNATVRERASAQPEQNCDPLGRLPGEALCPDRFTAEDLQRIKRRLGTYSFSALYQQRLTPPEGGLFKRAWFTRIVDRPPDNLRWCRGYDLAVSTNTNADYTASFRCALHKPTGDLYIADGFRRRIEFPEQRRYIVSRIRDERATEHGIEQALHGQAFIQELRREERLFGRAFRGIKVTADKFTRALAWANLAEEGRVVLISGRWIDEFLEEICAFPNAPHDDQLDAVSLAIEMLERQKHVALGF